MNRFRDRRKAKGHLVMYDNGMEKLRGELQDWRQQPRATGKQTVTPCCDCRLRQCKMIEKGSGTERLSKLYSAMH